MNENKINQILRNQIDIMFAAGINSGRIKSMEKLKKRMVETKKLLYPKQETPLAEQMEDVIVFNGNFITMRKKDGSA